MRKLAALGLGFAMVMVSTSTIAIKSPKKETITDSFFVEATCILTAATIVSDDDKVYGDAQYKLKVDSNILNATKSLEFSDITAPQIDQPKIYNVSGDGTSLAGKTIPVTDSIDVKFGGTVKDELNSGGYHASVTVTGVCKKK